MPTLSIIIPTFNSEKTISSCILSIARQKFQNYEVLIQDGKSNDKTLEIVQNLQALNPNISFQIFSEHDSGIYDAMNRALKKAKGEWVYFLGSDDKLFDEEVLGRIFIGDNLNYDILYGNVSSVRFGGIYDGEFTLEKLYNKNICHQAIFIKRKLFSLIGDFDISFKAYGDWEHNIRWFLNPHFSKKYVEVIVANYGEGGFSSRNADHQFALKKDEIFLKYGRQAIPRPFRKLLLQSRANQMKAQSKFMGYLKYKLLSMVYA